MSRRISNSEYCNGSKALYICASKRPCYCCSLPFISVTDCQIVAFKFSVVITHGKLYGNWNIIEGSLVKEFSEVCAKVVEKIAINENQNIQMARYDSSLFSGRSSGDDTDNSIFDDL